MVYGSADELLLMLNLSRIELENWADAILKDFLKDDYEAFAPINIEKRDIVVDDCQVQGVLVGSIKTY